MQEEVKKVFIEQAIECLDSISGALQLILQEYHVNLEEKKIEEQLHAETIARGKIK